MMPSDSVAPLTGVRVICQSSQILSVLHKLKLSSLMYDELAWSQNPPESGNETLDVIDGYKFTVTLSIILMLIASSSTT